MFDLIAHIDDTDLRKISDKINSNIRITPEEGLLLYKKADIEPTNICIYNCRFCSYHKPEGDPESWEFSHEEMLNIVKSFDNKAVTEVHIVGGVHPSHNLHYWGSLLKKIKEHRPSLHIKAFSAIELDHMISCTGCTIKEGLILLKEYGLDSIPGGGAEIFDEELREIICFEKSSSEQWLKIHETAHTLGIPSNATMLYGHIETYSHRIDHMERLRILQDRTSGFNAFIPLKYKKSNNSMSYLGEVNTIEDLRNYAISRVYLDNFPHIKAYWPMNGKECAQLSLSFGTDDMDGTIEDTTRIYSMAGSEEKNPAMTSEEICTLIRQAGFIPVERDSLYNPI
jgi:aminodeoxyfutalosine synthase